ncbi:HAD-IIIC family phosphatase [Komagataeibacter sp. AV436]|uniref:HAD-IIIC family phosphatase n=1 Tax=Komagataeibacter melomenusus TaxID=2766578 RepID=A0ABX2AGX2_9PROT|nr:HAD-IIIC family phosphatase [Komagataeibacter melomenusus]MBV1831314.1 HAD-IIIC family phosphatase [Komagataeibacter melomenusus]NPC67055.1 HAD-IIIC family phosphatase [Komagataeibacter melomenusus]
MLQLSWLPKPSSEWKKQFVEGMELSGNDLECWEFIRKNCQYDLSISDIRRVDKAISSIFMDGVPDGLPNAPIRLAILSSCTIGHLLSAIRVAAARRNLWIDIYTTDFGQYVHELSDASSALYAFKPDIVLFSLDSHHATASIASAKEPIVAREKFLAHLQWAWRTAREGLGATVIQQTFLPLFPTVLGNNEVRCEHSRNATITWLNDRLRHEDVLLLSVDAEVAQDGLAAWYDQMLWYRAKQEIHPMAAAMYGDMAGRLLAALRGLSKKCLVLDLDNTLWGGVIGDDGMEGIALGQGSALGEAYLAFQEYVLALKQRGVILAVCSKNTESVAKEVFEKHPEMKIRLSDIACFVANWTDKATNLRMISQTLNIGIDSLVFADDNPAERAIVRQELPMVAVPELPEDAGLYAGALARSGYFEGIRVTDDDLARSAQYQENIQRRKLAEVTTDIDAYLTNLDMTMIWNDKITPVTLPRVTQLINKTNQFNLTTIRTDEGEITHLMNDPHSVVLVMRLKDTFGDNGIISVITCQDADGNKTEKTSDLRIIRWVMSCRVLKRGVEQAAINLLAMIAAQRGKTAIIGEYRPTDRNAMVADLYERLGFSKFGEQEDGSTLWRLDIPRPDLPHHIHLEKA